MILFAAVIARVVSTGPVQAAPQPVVAFTVILYNVQGTRPVAFRLVAIVVELCTSMTLDERLSATVY